MRLGSPDNINKINEDDWFIEPYLTPREFYNHIKTDVFGLADFQRIITWKDDMRLQLLETILRKKSIGVGLISKQKEDGPVRTIRPDGTVPEKPHTFSILDIKQRGTAILMFFGDFVIDEDHELINTKFSFDPTVSKESYLDRVTKFKKMYVNQKKKFRHMVKDISAIWRMSYSEFENFKKDYFAELDEDENEYDLDMISDNLNDLYEAPDFPSICLRVHGINTTYKEDLDTFYKMNENQEPITYPHKVVSYLSAWVPESKQITKECIERSKLSNFVVKFSESELAQMAVGTAFGVQNPSKIKKLTKSDGFFKIDLESVKNNEVSLDKLFSCLKSLCDTKTLLEFNTLLEEEGFIHKSLRHPKKSAIQYCYIVYVLGKFTFSIDENVLGPLMRSLFSTCYLPIPANYSANITDAFVKIFKDFSDKGFIKAINTFMLNVWTNDTLDMVEQDLNQYLRNLFITSNYKSSGPLRLLYCYQIKDNDYPFLEPAVKTLKSYYMESRLNDTPLKLDNDHIYCEDLLESQNIERNLIDSSANICKASLVGNRGYKSNKEPEKFMAIWEEGFKDYKKVSEHSLEEILKQHGLTNDFHKVPPDLEHYLMHLKDRAVWQTEKLLNGSPNYIRNLLKDLFDKNNLTKED